MTAFSEIDKDTPVPLYYQISQQIRQQILKGELNSGDQIPTEKELQDLFDVSRATVRRAISELVYAGLLERKRGSGTTVTRGKVEGSVYGLGSFTSEVRQRGLKPKSKILGLDVVPAAPPVTGFLEVEQGEKLVRLDRVRIVSNLPVAAEIMYIRSSLVPGLEQSDFSEDGENQSTYFVFENKFGLRLHRAEDSIEAVGVGPERADLLDLPPGFPVLLRTRIAFTTGDVPAVYSSGLYAIKLLFNLEREQGEGKSVSEMKEQYDPDAV